MSIPSSGPLSMSQIRTALGVINTNFRLKLAETGSYGALNTNSLNVGSGITQLNGQAPHAMSKWRGYNGACTLVFISPSATTINQGQLVTLTASGASSYSWSTGQTTAQITVSPSSTTTFTVTGTTPGCKNTSASRTITVIPATTTTTTTTSTTTTTTIGPSDDCNCWGIYGGDREQAEFLVYPCGGGGEPLVLIIGPFEYQTICAVDVIKNGGDRNAFTRMEYPGCADCGGGFLDGPGFE